jgi:hypothetical protein
MNSGWKRLVSKKGRQARQQYKNNLTDNHIIQGSGAQGGEGQRYAPASLR